MTWDWMVVGVTLQCFKSKNSRQCQAKLHEASASPFHDQKLVNATKQINAILDSVGNDKDGRKLSFIVFKDQLRLVWATYGAVGPYDDDATVANQLGVSL